MENSAPEISPVRGLLNQRVSMKNFDLIRVLPSKKLSLYIENYWIIEWDLQDKPDYIQENLPHPSVNLVIDPVGTSGIFGVQRGKFTYRLSGSGRLFGAKFWPAAFFGFFGAPVRTLTDKNVAIGAVFGVPGEQLQDQFQRSNDLVGFVQIVEDMLIQRLPQQDEIAVEVRQIVELISAQPEILRVGHLAEQTGKSVRSLQRLFETYVGVSPKWVIERYRMLAAIDVINAGGEINMAEMAQNLGYFDSAHFGRAFQRLTGLSPAQLLTQS